jgi:Binding-protein-dependent transport system inner membrane component
MTDWLSPDEWRAVTLSLRVSFLATLASLPLGLFVAYALARWHFWGKQVLNGLVHLPLILPPVVTGYLLLITFGRKGSVGQYLDSWFGIVLAFRWTGAALAAGIMAFPLMVRAIRLAIEAVDPRLEQAAGTLGASRVWVSSPGPFSPLPRRWESSARQLPLCRTFPAKPRPCPLRSMPFCKCRAASRTQRVLSGLPSLLLWRRCWCRNGWVVRSRAGLPENDAYHCPSTPL